LAGFADGPAGPTRPGHRRVRPRQRVGLAFGIVALIGVDDKKGQVPGLTTYVLAGTSLATSRSGVPTTRNPSCATRVADMQGLGSGLARGHNGHPGHMRHIVVAAKAGSDQPWLAEAAADLSEQTGAAVSVVSVDGLEMEGLSPTPRSEFRESAQRAVDGFIERLKAAGIDAEGEVRPGQVTRGIMLFAEEKEADAIIVGASTKGRVARRVLGSVPVELIQRARRPVIVISPPS
jgi:nucleotide-binding universal stress UspA family protein